MRDTGEPPVLSTAKSRLAFARPMEGLASISSRPGACTLRTAAFRGPELLGPEVAGLWLWTAQCSNWRLAVARSRSQRARTAAAVHCSTVAMRNAGAQLLLLLLLCCPRFCRLPDLLDAPVADISLGQQQRVGSGSSRPAANSSGTGAC